MWIMWMRFSSASASAYSAYAHNPHEPHIPRTHGQPYYLPLPTHCFHCKAKNDCWKGVNFIFGIPLKDKGKHLWETFFQFSHAGGASENSCLQDAETDSLKSRSSFQFLVGDVLALMRFTIVFA